MRILRCLDSAQIKRVGSHKRNPACVHSFYSDVRQQQSHCTCGSQCPGRFWANTLKHCLAPTTHVPFHSCHHQRAWHPCNPRTCHVGKSMLTKHNHHHRRHHTHKQSCVLFWMNVSLMPILIQRPLMQHLAGGSHHCPRPPLRLRLQLFDDVACARMQMPSPQAMRCSRTHVH